MIIALAGRRIDAAEATTPRFPLDNVRLVAERVRVELQRQSATALISSAACGVDLIGLEQARALGLRRRVILPFDAQTFRKTSVVDRPGDWGGLYDQTLAEVIQKGDLVILPGGENSTAAYATVNRAILDEAREIGRLAGTQVAAVIVWDGQSRGNDDLTAAFAEEAKSRHIPVVEVRTTI